MEIEGEGGSRMDNMHDGVTRWISPHDMGQVTDRPYRFQVFKNSPISLHIFSSFHCRWTPRRSL